MFWAVGLSDLGWRRLWITETVTSDSYTNSENSDKSNSKSAELKNISRMNVMDIDVVSLVDSEGNIVDTFLPTENIYLSPNHCIYYNIPNGVLVNEVHTFKSNEIPVAGNGYYPRGVYYLKEMKFRDVIGTFWKFSPTSVKFPTVMNVSLFLASFAKKIADACIVQMKLTGISQFEDLRLTKWYEWFVHFMLYKVVKERKELNKFLPTVLDNIISLEESIEFAGRTLEQALWNYILYDFYLEAEPIVEFYIENPNTEFLYDKEHRDLNHKFSTTSQQQTLFG